ncbi:hypothetical protein CRUP_000023 [Coryphaenoides rupestris]|nr:hypothetical protein CRUP_000023 [Coryphaenoides rupestris]
MDKPTANFAFSIESIRQKLKANPLLLQIPVGSGQNFTGMIDLVSQQQMIWRPTSRGDNGRAFETKPLSQVEDSDLVNEAQEARAALIEKAVPVLCGSSLKNKGVQPLLDAITHYLPAPDERHNDLVQWYQDDLCALAFKVVHDKQRGPMVFLRIYSGTMKPQAAVHNINRDSVERLSRLLTVTGDTIVSSKASAAAAARRANQHRELEGKASVVLSGVETILCGMGELHIDIIHDRIRREYGIETYLGPCRNAGPHGGGAEARGDREPGRGPADGGSSSGNSWAWRRSSTDQGGEVQVPVELKAAVDTGVQSSYYQGVATTIERVSLEPGTSSAMVSACVSRCMLKESSCRENVALPEDSVRRAVE